MNQTTTTTDETYSVIAELAAERCATAAQSTTSTITEIMNKTSYEHPAEQLDHEVPQLTADPGAPLRTPDDGPPRPVPVDTTLGEAPVVTHTHVSTPPPKHDFLDEVANMSAEFCSTPGATSS